MHFFSKHRAKWIIGCLLTGSLLLYAGNWLSNQPSQQATNYNLGLKAHKKGDVLEALKQFDWSISAYKGESQENWAHRLMFPKPALRYAALAHFQRAKEFLQARQAEQAVDELQQSMRINPGDIYDDAGTIQNPYQSLSPEDCQILYNDAMFVRYVYELLMDARPDLANQQGKGKGKNGNGKKPAKARRQANMQPSAQAGKGRPDDI